MFESLKKTEASKVHCFHAGLKSENSIQMSCDLVYLVWCVVNSLWLLLFSQCGTVFG